MVSWIAQIIQIVSGFVIPRIIDGSMGAETLGVWDLGWSLVSYFTLLEGGIGGSINRHVALYRADQDTEKTNRIVSSVAMMQRAMGGVVLTVTVLVAWKLHWFLRDTTPALESEGRWLVILLGSSVALSFSGAIYTGIVTGCHRWAIHHGIYAATNVLSFTGMVLVLHWGMGITALALVHLVSELMGRVARAVTAYRVCPGLSIALRHADSKTLRSMLSFGGRMILGRVSQILMFQTTSVMIASVLGPAALALFTRPRSLVRQAAVFPQKYAIMLIPSVASVAAADNPDDTGRYVRNSVRNGLWMSLPIIVFLAVLGPVVMHLWMGPRYVNELLILVMALTLGAEVVNTPLNYLLMGLNLHGRPGVVSLICAGLSILLVWAALRWHGSLVAVALAMGIPWTFAYGIYLPVYACRRLKLPLRSFLKDACGLPLLCMIPFALGLLSGRLAFPDHPLASLLTGGLIGSLVLAPLYWRWALPNSLKRKLKRKFGGKPNAGKPAAEDSAPARSPAPKPSDLLS